MRIASDVIQGYSSQARLSETSSARPRLQAKNFLKIDNAQTARSRAKQYHQKASSRRSLQVWAIGFDLGGSPPATSEPL